MSRIFPFLLLVCILAACRQKGSGKPPVVSFYYWKTSMTPGVLLGERFAHFSPKDAPVFLRFFDVDYSAGHGAAVPVGDLEMESVAVERPLVPVVFITNRVFEKTKPEQMDSMAVKIARRIQNKLNNLGTKAWWKALEEADSASLVKLNTQRDSFEIVWRDRFVPEIQIDCDWTPTTRDAYFHFLEIFKKQPLLQTRTISCTVRLHQFRDRKENGIPPVSRGMLMCYNMNSPRDTSAQNAIFDLALLEGYLKNQPEYPLPLDVALPVFSWGAWFRGGEFRGLLSDWDAGTLSDTAYFHTLGGNMYQLRRDTVWAGDYLREGDLVRLDAPAENALIASTSLIKPLMSPGSRLLFFDWDTTKIAQYERLVPSILAGF